MGNDCIFYEKQRFNQFWLWFLFIGMIALFIYGSVSQILYNKPFGSHPVSDGRLLVITVLLLVCALLFRIFKLETQIKKDGIYMRFFPVHFRFIKFEWEEISEAYIRKYNPVLEYGGWGFRLGLFRKGKAYNISGNRGLQLVMQNGKRILIGTLKPSELEKAIRETGKHFS